MELNRLTSTRLAQYLDGLPRQLATHPQALTKATFSLLLRRELTPYLTDQILPPKIKSVLCAPWNPGDWIPTTAYVALCALARDHLWQTDEDYHRGMFHIATEMYNSPGYRALFFMFGPSIVAMSAAKRWDTLHQGTKLAIKEQKKNSIDLLLTYPTNLFNENAVQSLGAAFCAIAQGSRGQDPSFTTVRFGDTDAEFHIQWTY